MNNITLTGSNTLFFSRRIFFSTTSVIVTLLATSLFLIAMSTEANGVIDCDQMAWVVASETELNAAIDCFNGKTAVGNYTILLNQDISLTAGIQPINNTMSGVSLLIEGGGFVIDGQSIFNLRPFLIEEATHTTFQNITITRGGSVGVENSGVLTLINSIISNHGQNGSGDEKGGIINNRNGIITITQSTIQDNEGEIFGAGILNDGSLSINESIVNGNSSVSGGGILNFGTALINNTTIRDNEGQGGSGGGIYSRSNSETTINNSTVSNNYAEAGGGIHSSGTITITNSTISGNSSLFEGGGIETAYGIATISNSTISGNSIVTNTMADSGGGLYIFQATTTIIDSTINGNTSLGDGDNIHNEAGSLTIKNSIIADGNDYANCIGSIISNGYNISTDDSCDLDEMTDFPNTNPMLGPLQDNGGPTFTHALLEGSGAIDAGSTLLTQDQRGVLRPQGGLADIGSFELVQTVQYGLFLPLISN